MSQESLHSLGNSEVMLGARPKDKQLEAPEQLEETWERPSFRLETLICKVAQSLQQSMAEQIHNLQQQFTQTMTEQSQQTHKVQQHMTTQTQQIKQHQAEAEQVLAKVVRS